MEFNIAPSWRRILQKEFEKEYFKNLLQFVKTEYQQHVVYPPEQAIFNAFANCSFENVKVVIIGQDPYHGQGQANGLCFSVAEGVKQPPSLKNIFKEITFDLGKPMPSSGNLERWADQGVLLLNATLTVRSNTAGSHQNKGWEEFTDAVIEIISKQRKNVVFLLWGAYAQRKGQIIDKTKHLVLESAHPSPFAAYKGFFGNKHFSKTNDYLNNVGKEEVDW